MPKNDILSDLQNALLEDLEASVKVNSLPNWVSENRTVKGKPWNWVSREENKYGKVTIKDFRYLIPLYEDDADQIIIKKSRQMAVSEYGVNWIMGTITVTPYTTALHVFPNQDQAKKFSMVRLTPLFNSKDSPKLARLLVNLEEQYKNPSALQAAANVYHKQFINQSNYILSFIGGQNTKSTDARSVSADIIFLDEAKDLPEDKIADVLECMSLSSIRKMRMAGTPDFEGTVFDMRYNESDRREWVVTCKECGAKQVITFDSIKETKYSVHNEIRQRDSLYYYACVECESELDRTADHAQWVPQNPGAKTHGYHITQLMASWISADEIMQKKAENAKYPDKFANEVLGEVYQGGAKPLTLSKLLNNKVPATTVLGQFKYVTAGIDWGNRSHYVVLGADDVTGIVVLDYGMFEHHRVATHADRFIEIIDRWTVDLAVMDSGYGKAQTQTVFDARPDKAYSCFYKDSAVMPMFETITEISMDGEKVYLNKEDWQYHVTVDHSAMCDSLLNSVDTGRFKIPMEDDDALLPGVSELRGYLDNMCLATTVVADSRSGTSRRKWIITKAHYFAATAYAMVAMEHMLKNMDESGATEYFLPKGY